MPGATRASSGMSSDRPLFREVQYLREHQGLVLVLAVTVVAWTPLVTTAARVLGDTGTPSWTSVVALALIALVPTALIWSVRLIVEVSPGRIVIRFRPYFVRTIDLDDVADVAVISYRPLREYGGWGIKARRGRIAYSLWGSKGVRLTLGDGRTVLLGSGRPTELAAAITAARRDA